MTSCLRRKRTHAAGVTARPAGPPSPAAPQLPVFKSEESYRSDPGPSSVKRSSANDRGGRRDPGEDERREIKSGSRRVTDEEAL